MCIVAMGGAVLVAPPSSAEPTIAEVRKSVDDLYHEAEEASERFNDARVALGKAEARLATLKADVAREEAAFVEVRADVAGAIVAQYQSQGIGTTGQIALSDDPDSFLAGLQTVSAYHARQGDVLSQFQVQARQLELRKKAAARELAAIAETEKVMAAEKATIDEKVAEAEAVLDELEAEERSRLLAASRSSARVPADSVSVSASGRAKAVVDYAMAQVGDRYSWGAAGPDAFDCSGLTMMAWAQAGVALPHSSRLQRGYGMSVSQSALQPGDLVFYYSPISHVGIYIGNGMIVHAANPGTGVRVAPLNSMPYVGATRPG